MAVGRTRQTNQIEIIRWYLDDPEALFYYCQSILGRNPDPVGYSRISGKNYIIII
jgi:hypothetical protein